MPYGFLARRTAVAITLNIEHLIALAIYSLALGAASSTIACGRIFKAFRVWAHTKSLMLGALVSCPYCTAHWLSAFGLIAVTIRPIAVAGPLFAASVLSWGIAWLASIALGAMTVRLIGHVNKTDQERIIEGNEVLIAALREQLAELRMKNGVAERELSTHEGEAH